MLNILKKKYINETSYVIGDAKNSEHGKRNSGRKYA